MEGTILCIMDLRHHFILWLLSGVLSGTQLSFIVSLLCLSSPPLLWFHHQTKPEAVVVSYLVFIKQHSTSSQEYADTAVPVLTSRGLLCPASNRVHFSPEYDNINLPKSLPGREKTTHFPQAVLHNGSIHSEKTFCGLISTKLLLD